MQPKPAASFIKFEQVFTDVFTRPVGDEGGRSATLDKQEDRLVRVWCWVGKCR